MLAELAVLAGRAAAARTLLESLLDVVPPGYWDRRAEGQLWSAREHLEHVATVDEPMHDLVRAAVASAAPLRPYDAQTLAEAASRREALMLAVADEPIESLREHMTTTRARLLMSFETLDAVMLEVPVLVPGSVNAWGQPLSVSFRHYLASWAVHDAEHTEAIRQAITTPPSPGDLALAARRRRR